MEWGADRILALRKHAGMTQAQIAQWLGVTIKQVKYLEHQRRKPSGPTRRLLSILAAELSFSDSTPVQVLGASAVKRSPLKHVVQSGDLPLADTSPPEDTPAAKTDVVEVPEPGDEKPLPPPEAEEAKDGGAFVWQ